MRVAFCPGPPLLLPEVGVGPDLDLEELRVRCREAVAALLDPEPQVVVVLASPEGDLVRGTRRVPGTKRHPEDEGAGGTFAPWGVDVRVGSDVGAAPTLGLAHAVGAWLLDEAGRRGPRRYVVPGELDVLPEGAALLVIGDGSATRTPKAPGSYDANGEVFDATVAAALAAGDPMALRRLDAGPELRAQGVDAWHEAGRLLGVRTYDGLVLADQAPFGVGYFVAVWTA